MCASILSENKIWHVLGLFVMAVTLLVDQDSLAVSPIAHICHYIVLGLQLTFEMVD